MGLRDRLRWHDSSEIWKTILSLGLILTISLSGYTALVLTMGNASPLVVVTSESMVPTLGRGDLLIIQTRPEDNISLGDIIVFWADWFQYSPIVHRVVDIIEDENGGRLFVTKGDNNPSNDRGERTIEDILGVVVMRIPYLGHVSLFLRTVEGTTLFVAFFAVLFILPELFDRFKKES